MEQGEIILYQPDDTIKLEVRMENETVWLSIEEMSNLFGRDISVIGKHIRNIFKEEELVKDSGCAKFAYTASGVGSSPGRVQSSLKIFSVVKNWNKIQYVPFWN